ncbi:MAG: hypothetical protein ABI477_15235 [Chryseolinea sp.]
MRLLLLSMYLFLFQDKVPFKPNEEFDLKLKFEFKERTHTDPNKVSLDPTNGEVQRNRGSGPLPYLFLNLQVLKQAPSEIRVKVFEAGKLAYNKKVDLNTIIKLDLGFTDDIKDRVSAYEYTVMFYTESKEPVSRIVVYFHKDGTYLVNEQVRGKL